jgi:hypothetical protein
LEQLNGSGRFSGLQFSSSTRGFGFPRRAKESRAMCGRGSGPVLKGAIKGRITSCGYFSGKKFCAHQNAPIKEEERKKAFKSDWLWL